MSKLDKLLTAPCAELRSPLIMALRTGSDRGIVCRIQSRPLLISKVPLRSCRNNFHVVLLAFYYFEFRDLSLYPLLPFCCSFEPRICLSSNTDI